MVHDSFTQFYGFSVFFPWEWIFLVLLPFELFQVEIIKESLNVCSLIESYGEKVQENTS